MVAVAKSSNVHIATQISTEIHAIKNSIAHNYYQLPPGSDVIWLVMNTATLYSRYAENDIF